MSPFTPKDWKNYPDLTTPIDDAALTDMETRLSGYTDSEVTGLVSRSEGPLRFDFSDPATFTGGQWALLAGTLPTVASGVASPAANETVVVRAFENYGDCEASLKVSFPVSVTAGKSYGLAFKVVDVNNLILAQFTTNNELQLWKKVAGVWTSYPTHAPITVAANTSYWIVARVVRNTFEAEFWTTNPDAGGSPTATRSQTFTAGDITAFGAGVRGRVGLRLDSQAGVTVDDAEIAPVLRPRRQRDVQIFTSSGTWTKPSGAALDPLATVKIMGLSGGSGGGSGARRASATPTSGGGGGGGGSYMECTVLASATVTGSITVGTGGGGGAAVTVNDTNGNNGGAGAQTRATILAGGQSFNIGFWGGVGGGGNTVVSGGGGGVGGNLGASGGGGAGGVGLTGNAGGSGLGFSPGGGGAGGGINVTPTAFGGGVGGYNYIVQGSVPGGAIQGGAGATPTFPTHGFPFLTFNGTAYTSGAGGGGGAASTTGAGGAGGNGQNYGAGGGGGGCSLNGFNSGAGGAGAPGVCVVITEWGG